MSFQQQNHSRRILPPVAPRKRKEQASSNGFKPPAPRAAKVPKPAPSPSQTTALAVSSNRLLAGYMAHEYLTKGTLFGQKFDPARAEAVPLASSSAQPRKAKGVEAGKEGDNVGAAHESYAEVGVEAGKEGDNVGAAHESYAEVASILKAEGAHIPGIVNPTQLAKWIQM